MENYKQTLLELQELQGQSGEAAFERITRMVKLHQDSEFAKNECGNNELKVVKWLDSLCQDLFECYHVLAEMLRHFPNKEAWKNGKLSSLRKRMIEEIAEAEKASKAKPKALQVPREADVIKQLPKPLRSQVSAVLASKDREAAAVRQVAAKQRHEIDYRKQEEEAIREECLALRKKVKSLEELLAIEKQENATLHRQLEAMKSQHNRARELATA